MQNPSANHLNLESRRLVIGVLGVLLGTSAGIAEPPARVSQNVMAANANSTARLLTAPQPPTWAQGLELFGVASIDGIQTAFFGSRDRLHVLSLMVGEKWPGGIELRSIRERAAAGTIAAELAWKTETAILECRWEGVETTPDALIIEPAPTTGLPLPPRASLVFSSIPMNAKSEKESDTISEKASAHEARPAVVSWPRKIDY